MSVSDENNIEIVWLLSSINNSQETVDTLEQVQSLINHLKTFKNIIECEQFIRSVPKNDRIIFIVEDLLGQQIIPQIHDLQQVVAIYVFSFEKQTKNELWFRQFSKFRGIGTQIKELAVLSKNHCDEQLLHKDDDLFSFDILDNHSEQDKSTVVFIHSY